MFSTLSPQPLDNIEIDDDKTDDRTILTMMLRRPTPEQAGEYQCLARNPAGESTQPFTLDTEGLFTRQASTRY